MQQQWVVKSMFSELLFLNQMALQQNDCNFFRILDFCELFYLSNSNMYLHPYMFGVYKSSSSKNKCYSPQGFQMWNLIIVHESNIGLQSLNHSSLHYKLVMLCVCNISLRQFCRTKSRNICKMAREFCFFVQIVQLEVRKKCNF